MKKKRGGGCGGLTEEFFFLAMVMFKSPFCGNPYPPADFGSYSCACYGG